MRVRAIVAASLVGATAIVATGGVPILAAGNAGIHFHKTVAGATVRPTLSFNLAVDRPSAIPGDTLTYSGTVSNTATTWSLTGAFTAESHSDATSTVAYYWDELQYCFQGCGTGENKYWTSIAAFVAGQPAYIPVQAPDLVGGMSLTAVGAPASGVKYPPVGDGILGSTVAPGATATWSYQAIVTLTAAQVALLSDPARVQATRNLAHFEVTTTNPQAAEPWSDSATFTNSFSTNTKAGNATNLVVHVTEPNGSTVNVDIGTLAPGASAPYSTTFRVPVPAPKAAGETDAAYLSRLTVLEGSLLTASATLSGTGSSGPVSAPPPAPVITVEHLPMVTIAKTGPASVDAGTDGVYSLALANIGGASAGSLRVTDSVPGGATGIVTGVPGTLSPTGGPGDQATATSTFPIPASQPSGSLTDTATVAWQDSNHNPYGPMSSQFTTEVRNQLFGARLTLTPESAGPNVPGTTQILTATLLDRNGNPLAGQLVTFHVTGANPGSGTATTDASGHANFTYTGANPGDDVVQATATAQGVTVNSNTSTVTWARQLQRIAMAPVDGNFFPNSANSCTFDVSPDSTPVFSQTFPDILFNPAATVVPHNISTVTNFTRPFTDLTVDVNGNYNGQIVAQGNGQQAGAGGLINFYGVFTGSLLINEPGDLTFRILHDDGYIFGVGNGATRVSGDLEGNPPATTPFNGYGVAAAWNTGSAGSSSSGTATVHFPAAGSYPFELDYTECGAGALFLDLITEQFVAQTDPLSVYVGYADALRAGGSIFPFPWQGSPNVIFEGGGCCDNGAFRFDNSGTTAITIDQVTVDVGARNFDLWPRNLTLPPGQIMIFTGTAGENFDTSDLSASPCNVNNGVIPKVNVTIGGVTTGFMDTTQVLNTGGFDLACIHNESTSWLRIGGGGAAINVPLPPAASLDISPFTVPGALLGQNQALTVSAMDGAGNAVANLPVTLQVIGPNAQTLTATTSSSGLAVFGYVGVHTGTDSIQASAFIAGLRSISNLGSVTWKTPLGGGPDPGPNPDPNAPPPPSITGPAPTDGTIVTKPVSVTASIAPPTGQTIASWRVFYQALDPGPQVVIASGSGTPPATLATFDPTQLPNDTYGITVEATASGGGIQDLTTTVVVLGNLKIGRYTATFQDLSVPVSGLQMEVRRTYDSIDKSTGDFGVGWKVGVSNFRVAPNHLLGASGWTMYNTQCFFGLCLTAYKDAAPRFVTVTFPDQHTEVFDFTPGGGSNLFWDCTATFTARGSVGTTSKLVPLDDTGCSYRGDGNIYGSGGALYNPQRFQLTTRDGQVFVLDRQQGLISQADSHGNKLTVDSSGVHSTTGGSITFTRDSAGRITRITGPSGETFTYTYSGAGDLASVTDAKGSATTFSYDGDHNLTSTTGPGGQPLASATYDASGRMTSITDATGQTVQISNDVQGQQEVITDPSGESFVATLNDRGDLLSQAEVADGHANTYSFTYDSLGRQLSSTDPLGNTSHMTYDSAGDLVTSTDAQGRQATMTYGSNGELLTFTDPAGGVTTYSWDSALNLISVTDAAGALTTYTYDSAGNRTSERNALGAVTSYTYNSSGRVLSQTDSLGRATAYAYDSSGHLLSQTDPAGNRTSYTYDPDGLLASSTDPTGAATHYVHDALGRTNSVTDPLGRITTYAYDGDGRVTSKTDPLRGTTTYTYDSDGRVLTETDPAGGVLTYAYDGHGRVVTLTDAIGRVTHRAYDDAGNLVSETNPAGGVTTYTYGKTGLKTSAKDPLGRMTTYTYDSRRLMSTQTNALGQKTTYAYDGMGRPTAVTDPLGATTKYEYDAAGQRVTQTDPMGAITSYHYNLAGEQTGTTDATGRTTGFSYNLAGSLASTTDPAGHAMTYRYDAAGRQIQAVTALGRSTSFAYDSDGELITKTDPLGNVTRYTYDAGGRQITVTSPRGGVTTTAYDPAGRPVKVTDALGADVNLGYDAAGQRTSITDPDGDVTSFTYGSLGGVTRRTFAWGGAHTYTYDASGQLVSETNARGTTATDTYDGAGHLVGLSVPGASFTQSFDGAGRRASFTDSTGTTSFTYDAAGRTTSMVAPAGTIGYTYDAAGRRASETLPGGRKTAYSYDAAGLIAVAGDWVGGPINFTHDADGELTSMTRLGSTTNFTYDAAGRTGSISHLKSGTTIDSFTYTYDADGNRTSVASNAGTESYTLDLDGRLTGIHYPDGTTASYAYDAAGNRVSATSAGATTTYVYDSSGRLISAGSASIGYDADGNVVSRGADSFAYDWAGRMTSATVGGIANTFTYNADGARVATSRAGTVTNDLVDESGPLPLVVGDGTNTYVRDPSGSLLEWRDQAGAATAPLADALGSIRNLTDATGNVTGSAAYGAYGDPRSQAGADSPFGFTGEQADATGLVYLRARYYDPSLGRFLTPDSLDVSGPGSIGYNRYAYAGDNPTTLTDPSGHQATLEFRLLLGAMALVSAYLLWSIGQQIIAILQHSCIYNASCFTAPAIPRSGDGTLVRPLTRPVGRPLDKSALKDLAKAAVTACAAAGTYGALAGGAANNPCNLLQIDVFFIGLDLPQVTAHDVAAIATHPFAWDVLIKADNPLTTTNRTWYNSQPQCNDEARSLNPGMACDEYPFYTTEEGGPELLPVNLGADLKLLDPLQNSTQGSRLRGFTTRCGIPTGDVYLVSPGPTTYGVCKFR